MDGGMTHAEIAVEDGHCPVTTPPNGIWPLTCHLPEVGIWDYECRVSWELAGDRMCIFAIDFDGEDGAQGIDPNGTSMERAMYARLASIALSQRDDILNAYYSSL